MSMVKRALEEASEKLGYAGEITEENMDELQNYLIGNAEQIADRINGR